MFWNRKSAVLSLESLDARVRELEARLGMMSDNPRPSVDMNRTIRPVTPHTPSTEAALRSLARTAGFEMPGREG